jgi:hypothetical protein
VFVLLGVCVCIQLNQDVILGLKQIIKQQKLLASGAVDAELVLPGEPLIYSIKYAIGQRTRGIQFFRNEKWKSLLKSYFPSYYRTKTPVVILIRFFVSPPSGVTVKHADLVRETVPAVYSYELCEYLLSFLEMLHHVLINSYRQVVKVDVEKFYSADPRTVFKFIKWDYYVNLQNNYTAQSQGKSFSADGKVRPLQSELSGNDPNKRVRKKADKQAFPVKKAFHWSSPRDRALSDSGSCKSAGKKTRPAAPDASHEEA